eukprot:2085858-Pyramimonas_sp.AAC.1
MPSDTAASSTGAETLLNSAACYSPKWGARRPWYSYYSAAPPSTSLTSSSSNSFPSFSSASSSSSS